MAAASRNREMVIICVLLALAVGVVYWQAVGFGLTTYDDELYITNNPHVRSGLTFANLRWAFTTTYAANWHPLTWISLMFDVSVQKLLSRFGVTVGVQGAGVFHLTNVFLHVLNSILLFLVLTRMAGSVWRSAFVAALFALHPLHVESVAWVTERKDVLSTLFWLLTMLAYVSYAKSLSRGRMALVAVTLGLGLMAKPMLVTLPIVLLLVDFWPLGRKGARALAVEKLPLFVLAAVSCAVTFWAQKIGGAVQPVEVYPLKDRLLNAVVSYGAYVMKMLWPAGLSPEYPYRTPIPIWEVILSTLFVVAATVGAFRAAKHNSTRWVAMGWLWYVITLIPVIGIVQVGSQAMADRYSYVPLIGLFIVIAWGVPYLAEKFASPAQRVLIPKLLFATALLVLLSLGIAAHRQVGIWQNDLTLFSHALRVTTQNASAHYGLAHGLALAGKTQSAVEHLKQAVEIEPTYADAHSALAGLLTGLGRPEEAAEHGFTAIDLQPDHAAAHGNLALALLELNRLDEAEAHYRTALRLDPNSPKFHFGLAMTLAKQDKPREALPHCEAAVRLDPKFLDARNGLAITLAQLKRYDRALREFAAALKLSPNNPVIVSNRSKVLAELGRYDEAVRNLRKVLKRYPGNLQALETLREVEAKMQGKRQP